MNLLGRVVFQFLVSCTHFLGGLLFLIGIGWFTVAPVLGPWEQAFLGVLGAIIMFVPNEGGG